MWAPWRLAYIGGDTPESADGCFLCRAAEDGEDGDGAELRVESTEHTLTVLNRYPYSSGHVMVVPRRHVPEIAALTSEESLALMTGAQRAVAALGMVMGPQGFNLGINQGYSAGGSVTDHLHLHVVPRWAGDTNFMPVLADVKVLPELLVSTCHKLREAFQQLASR